MTRSVQEPAPNEHGAESHPAFGMISGSRVSQSGEGAVLFDSEIRHGHYVALRVKRADRKRDLGRDWLHADITPLIEIAMSEAQWAQFVSSMNTEGTACTIRYTEADGDMPDLPFAPRMEKSQTETRTAAHHAFAHIKEAFAAVELKPTKANIRTLKYAIENAPANVEFAAKSLSEHAENVVQKARADVEAMVTAKATSLGLGAADTPRLSLTAGDDA